MSKRGNGEGTITALKEGRWQGRVRYINPNTGEKLRKAVYGKTQKEVREKLKAFIKEIEKGVIPNNGKITFGEWLESWLEEHVKRTRRLTTWENYETITRVHIKPCIGQIQISKLQARDLQTMYNQKLDNGRVDQKGGLSGKTVGLIHLVCSMALEQAVKEGIISRNVADLVTKPKKVKKEIHPMSEEQIREFLIMCKDDRMFTAFYLLLSTGIRRGELLGLKWEDIDFENGRMCIQRSLAKTNTQRAQFHEPKTTRSKRMIPLTTDVVKELKKHKERQAEEKEKLGAAYSENCMVFCREDGIPIYPDVLDNRFHKILARAGLPHFRVHDLRHTFATMMLKQDVHAKIVQEILGHSTISVTLDTYSHVLPGMKEESMKKMQAVVVFGEQIEDSK